jgi:hypothetical protein
MNRRREIPVTDPTYDVLSPWAETDPLPLQGITPRLPEITGKRIGLYANYKRAAGPIQDAVHAELRARFGEAIAIQRFAQAGSNDVGSSDEGARFAAWLEGVDAVIVAVGD